MNTLSYVFIMAVLAHLLVEFWLGLRHIRHINQHKHAVPEDFAQNIELKEHKKSAVYTIAKKKLALFGASVAALLTFFWTIGGGFEQVDNFSRNLGFDAIWTGVFFILTVGFLMGVLSLPFSIYATFSLEKKFGFNRTTAKTFIMDIIKSWVLSLMLGVPLLWVILWLMDASGSLWWLWVWIAWLSFNLLMMWLYPTLIAPIFNKFKPLEDLELKAIIDNLLNKTGFSNNGIFIMDGSKRTGHGNAYFTGFGHNKRIVFFDTLLNSLNHKEAEAVLAHELGHFKHKHIKKRMISMAFMSLLSLWFLGLLINQNWFYQGLGMNEPSAHAALILFFTALPVFSFFITPISTWFSRKHEYEADTFAVLNSDGKSLISALVNMYKDNASTLTPDSLHSLVYDSHPPAPLRINHIKQKMS